MFMICIVLVMFYYLDLHAEIAFIVQHKIGAELICLITHLLLD